MAQIIYDVGSFLEVEQLILGITGFYPSRIKRTFVIKLVNAFLCFVTFGQMAAVINFAFSSKDVTELSEAFLFSMTQVGLILKVVNHIVKLKNVYILDRILRQEIYTRVTQVEADMLKESFRKCQRAISLYNFSRFGVVVMFGVFPAVDSMGTGQTKYPFPGKFPFNPDNYFLIIYLGEVLTVAISALCNGALDCIHAKHLKIASTLFEILGQRLERLLDTTDLNANMTVNNRIKHCAIYYQETIRYVSIIKDSFSYGILVQFACSAIVICLTGFQLALVVDYQSAQFASTAIYFVCMMGQLLIYCWHGHLLMEKSDAITKSCYAAKWNEIGIAEQKMLIIIMERAKQPTTFKPGGIFTINLITYVGILRSSYSYFALLRRIYGE